MSVSMVWVVSAVDAGALQRWSPVWTERFDRFASRRDMRDRWRSWLDDGQPDEALAALFSDLGEPHWEQLNSFRDDCASDELTDVHVTRRVSATEALFYAIGPQRARLLPGFLGNFILTPSQLVAALPDIQAVCGFPPGERDQVLARIDDALADSAPRSPEDVLDVLPRRGRWAADRSMGLVSICQPTA